MTQVVNIEGVGKVNFPDTMTPEQIQQAIETDILPNQRKSGFFENEVLPNRARPRVLDEPMPVEGPGRWARVGRGAEDVMQGAVQRLLQLIDFLPNGTPSIQELRAYTKPEDQHLPDAELLARYKAATAGGLAPLFTQQVNDELALYDKGRQAQGGGFDSFRMLGNVAATAPLAMVGPAGTTMGARALQGALSGGESGLLQFQKSGELLDTAKSAGVGAAVGAVAAPVIGAATDKGVQLTQKLLGRLKGAIAGEVNPADLVRDIPELNTLSPQAQRDLIAEAQDQIRKTGTLDAEQIARKANLLANDVTPTKSMVTRSPRDWTMERNLQKLSQSPDEQLSNVGQELTSVYQANDKALGNKLTGLGKGLPQGTQEAHGMAVMQSLDDLATASQKDVSALYETVRAAKGDQLASDAQNLASTLDDLRDSTYAEKLVSSVNNKLRRFGMLDKDGNLTHNTLTVTQAEELRKFVNRLPNDFGKSDIIRAIDADVMSGLGEDAFGVARSAAKARFESLNNPATQKALNTLGELTQGKTAQNFIKSQVIDAADQDVASLIGTLNKLPKEQAAQAQGALQAGILQHLQDKAINVNSGKFSGAAFNKAMDQIGEKKLVQIFGVPKYSQLRSLARAALDATYEPTYSAVNYSGTAPMLMSLIQKGRAIPGVPLLLSDEAQKLAARSGYSSQLADALSAKASGQLPQLPATLANLAQAIRSSAGPTSAAALNQFREPANQRNKKRQ